MPQTRGGDPVKKYNPIHEFASFVERLCKAGGTVGQALSVLARDGEDKWEVQARGMNLFLRTRELLTMSRRLEANAQVLDVMRNAFITPDDCWDTNVVPEVDAFALTALRNVADAEDITPHLPPVLGTAELDTLQGALEEMRKMLGGATELPENVRWYMLSLINQCLDIISGGSIDFVLLRSITLETYGMGILTSAHLKRERRGLFVQSLPRMVDKWFLGFTVPTARGIAAQTTTDFIGD